MKRIVHPTKTITQTSLEEEVRRQTVVKDVSSNDISIDRLLTDGLLGIYREVKNLLYLSAKGKLSPTDAKDLRDTVKLLFELKDREKDLLENLTNEDLEKLKDEPDRINGWPREYDRETGTFIDAPKEEINADKKRD